MFPYIIQGDNVTIVVDSKPHSINKTHISYQKVLDAIKENDEETIREIIDTKDMIEKYSKGHVTIENGIVSWKGKETHNMLTKKIVSMLEEGFPIEPLVNFMENLMQNPSYRAVNELYGFLEVGDLPITPDGHFLAYKRVRGDYLDVYSGSINNSVGQIVEMERNAVNENSQETCSYGLHFCSYEYLKSFSGERVMVLKINPRDVVSIPVDYNNTKGRCCRYEVVGEVEDENEVLTRAVDNSY